MTEEHTKTIEEAKEESKEAAMPKRTGVGASLVGPISIVLIMAYLILFSILLLYSLVQFWPPPAPAEGPAPTSLPVAFLFWTFSVSAEVRLLLIVALAGALGSLVHVLRSFSRWVGERQLERSWLPRYILLPFLGPTVALVFYFVIRGGFLTPQVTAEDTSPYGFAALAGLVGMFSDPAMEKLREVFGTLLALAKEKAKQEPEEEAKPKPGEEAKPKPGEEG